MTSGPQGFVDMDEARALFREILQRRRAEAGQLQPAAGARPSARPVPFHTKGSPAWEHFVKNYIPGWNGDDKNWDEYCQWIRFFAKDRGVLPEAERLLAAANASVNKVGFFTREGVTLIPRAGTSKEKDENETPSKDRDGRDVAMVLSTRKESDGIGDLLWVRMENGAVGKLYVDTLEFVDSPLPTHLENLPTEDNQGRPVKKVRSEAQGDKRVVLIGGLWGLLDAAGHFIATGPEEDAYADWSTRVVTSDGYLENGILFKGEWYRPWPDKQIYLYQREGTMEWARGSDRTKSPTVDDQKAAQSSGSTILSPGTIQKVLAGRTREFTGTL